MKTTKLFFMAALALMTAACSNSDNDILTPTEQPTKAEGIPFTATISLDKSASTRALTEDVVNKKLVATWATGEKVALIYNVGSTPTKTDAVVTAQGDGTATISATLESGASDGSNVTIIYPSTAADGTTGNVKAALLNTQEGTLDAVATNYDVRKGTGTLSISGTATVNNGTPGTTVSLTNQFAIWKLTLQNGGINVTAKTLTIKDAGDNLLASATLASAGSEFYIAVPAMTSVNLTAVNGTTTYNYSKPSVNISTGNYYQSIVSLCNDLSAQESANCYLIPAKGKYKFKATVKGNGSADLGGISKTTDASTIKTAELIWATFNTTVAPTANELIKDITYSDGYVYFSTGDTYKEGNALVAIKDVSNNILWSWHLWFESDDMDGQAQIDPVSGYTFMDRNLGALTNCYDAGNALDFGFTYQRGRKDPFMTSATRTSYTALGVLGTYTSYSGSSGVANSIKNPTVVFSYDYWGGNGSLWSASSKTIFDPCPPGWHIAGVDAWNGFNSTNFVIYNNDWDTYHGRMYNGVAWYPATGDRWGPDHNNTGGRLDIWGERELYASSTEILGNAGSNPGHGYSIRAVK